MDCTGSKEKEETRAGQPLRCKSDNHTKVGDSSYSLFPALTFNERLSSLYSTSKSGNHSLLPRIGHDAQCFPNLVVHRAVPGEVNATLKIENYNLNRVGTVHGGLILSMTDTLGSLAVASRGYWMTGVSTDIGTSFVRPAGRPGDVLHVKAVLTALGKSLAYTRVDFTNPAGELVAYGYHTKYVGKSSTHQKNVKLSEDGEQVLEGEDIDID